MTDAPTPERLAQERQVRAIRRTCLGTLEDGRPCGADINALICAQPFDGASHEYECPRCARKGHFTSPRFNEQEEEPAT